MCFITTKINRLYSRLHKAALIYVVALLLLPTAVLAKEFKVTIIPSSNSLVYLKTINSINNIVDNYKNGQIIIDVKSLDELINSGISSNEDSDLMVPIGQRAMKSVINLHGNHPVLSTLVTRLDFNEILQHENQEAQRKIGAIFIDQPLKRYLLFTRLALPDNKRFGFLVSREYKNILSEFDSVTSNYPYHLEIYHDNSNLINQLLKVAYDSDVIIALPDSNIFNRRNTHNILLSTYRKLIPLIGFSESYVRAGALAGIYSTPELIGKQTGELIINLSRSDKSSRMPVLFSNYFEISVNNKVARSLGLPMLDKDKLITDLMNAELENND